MTFQIPPFGFNAYRDNHLEFYRESHPFSLPHFPSIPPFSDLGVLTDFLCQSNLMSHQDQSMQGSQQSMQGQGSPHIDPSLNHLQYPSYYGNYQSQPQHPQSSHHLPQHLSVQQNYSSPSSGGSDTIGTPPVEHMYPPSSSSGVNSKRPASAISNATASSSRKKARRDEEDGDAQSPAADKDDKPKPTRGSRACTVCRRLKMKCVGAENGPPCKRCMTGNHECIFEESNRGKRSAKKHEALSRSVRKMEKTLDTVLKAMGNPGITSGLLSRTPSPSPGRDATTQELLAASPSPPPQSSYSSHPHSQPPSRSHLHPPPGSPKLHSLPDNALNPLGLLAEASLANRRSHAPKANGSAGNPRNDNPQVGVASDNYFKPGPMTILPLRRLFIERQIQPEMLSFVTTEEVVALFKIYFEHIHMHCGILDPNFHTPSLVCSRSPFLLTTICSIASKFYTKKPDLHPRLTELAKKLAFSVPAKGYKSVEIVQAYLLLALWGCGAVERYEQDKTWLLLGMAIRMGTDLNLHRKTATTSVDTAEGRARDIEVHNRERTWILCFALDRSFSAQMGKPNTIKEDYIIRHADQWYQSPVAIPADASLVAYVELQRILSRSIDFLYSSTDTVNGLQTSLDYLLVIKTFEAQLYQWQSRWANDQTFLGEPTPSLEYKRLISEFYFNYAMLVLNSFGLQNALERAHINIPHFFARCHSSAMTCASIVRDQLGPRGFIRYSPDSHFVQMSYAVLSLLKLIRPEFQAFLDDEQKTLQLVKDVADVLDDIAANPLHTPALYSGFLRALISAKLEPSSNSDPGFSDHGRPDDHSMGDMNQGYNHMDMHGYSQQGNRGHHHPMSNQHQHSDSANGDGTGFSLMNEFQLDGEMGPVADMSTFPPTMAPPPNLEDNSTGLTMENFLGSGFWDSMLVPGYNSLDGFSGGFVFGAGGSGLITPRFGMSPMQSGTNTPGRQGYYHQGPSQLTQHNINAAFKNKQLQEGSAGLPKNDASASAAS